MSLESILAAEPPAVAQAEPVRLASIMVKCRHGSRSAPVGGARHAMRGSPRDARARSPSGRIESTELDFFAAHEATTMPRRALAKSLQPRRDGNDDLRQLKLELVRVRASHAAGLSAAKGRDRHMAAEVAKAYRLQQEAKQVVAAATRAKQHSMSLESRCKEAEDAVVRTVATLSRQQKAFSEQEARRDAERDAYERKLDELASELNETQRMYQLQLEASEAERSIVHTELSALEDEAQWVDDKRAELEQALAHAHKQMALQAAHVEEAEQRGESAFRLPTCVPPANSCGAIQR